MKKKTEGQKMKTENKGCPNNQTLRIIKHPGENPEPEEKQPLDVSKEFMRDIKEEMDKIASLHNDLSIRIYLLVSHKEIEEDYLQRCHEARDTIYNLQKKLLKAL